MNDEFYSLEFNVLRSVYPNWPLAVPNEDIEDVLWGIANEENQ